MEYFAEGVKYSLSSAEGKIRSMAIVDKYNQKPTDRETDLLGLFNSRTEITSADVVGVMNVSRQLAVRMLNSLTKKGLLRKKGKTRGAYYVLG